MYYWPEADDVVVKAVADYLRSKMIRWGIPFTAPAFQAYSASFGPYGGTNTVRMTGSTWNAYQGIVGHQHVPENVHGDPGAFPVAKLIGFLQAGAVPVVTAPVKTPVYIPPKLVVDGAFGLNTVKALQRWLGVMPDGDWGPASKRALQRKLGVRIDGLIGTATIRALQKKVGATPDGVWGKNTTMALQRFLNTL
jgi:peptidoglycan hydrolase-like protein with peptidoglycan-binding domain